MANPKYQDLRDFVAQLEKRGELKRITQQVDPHLEMTEICDRTLRGAGPALLFERPTGHTMPVLANLFGTPERVALGMGEESTTALREVGKMLAYLKEPEPPSGRSRKASPAHRAARTSSRDPMSISVPCR